MLEKKSCIYENFQRRAGCMKKKSVLFFLLFALTVFSLSANQVTYDYTDKEYKFVKYFSQISNMTGPHDTTPVSGSLLTASLNRVDKTSLPIKLQSLYENLSSRLTDTPSLYKSETMMLDLDTLISPEIYLKAGDHANRADWYNGYDDRKALLALDVSFGWSEYVYGKINLPYKIKIYDQYDDVFSQNIFKPNSGESYQRRMPFDAGISVGNSFLNFYLGRGQLNMGSGFSGNLFVADNFQYQDFAKLSFYDDFFSYDLTYTHFDQEKKWTGGINSLEEEMSFDGKHQSRITHSYTFDIADKVSLSLREGAILQTQTALDLRMFNPFMFLHNWNGFSSAAGYWANNIMGLEVTAALGLGLRMDFQFVLDQFQLPNEAASSSNAFPNAMGGLFNISHVAALEKGFIENHFEIVYTSPYLYLNCIGENNENQDFIVGYYLGDSSDISYSGYKYGPDSIVLEIGGNYITYDEKLDLSYALMYRIHGEHGIKYSEDQNQTPVSVAGNADMSRDFALTGTLEHTLLANASVDYKILESLSVFSSVTYQYKMNYNNKAGDWQNLQLSIGCTFNPMAFVEKK